MRLHPNPSTQSATGYPPSPGRAFLGRVNRTDRLYALVEELRAIAPRARTAHQLANHFEVSVRTVERDISALQASGVPIWATPGPGAGTRSTRR
jgi:predicted DNA-binding transcriptional regulator YafY